MVDRIFCRTLLDLDIALETRDEPSFDTVGAPTVIQVNNEVRNRARIAAIPAYGVGVEVSAEAAWILRAAVELYGRPIG